MTNLFPKFAPILSNLPAAALEDPRNLPALRLESCRTGRRSIEMIYAPFDHVNAGARIVIVGLTPGRQQAARALQSAQQSLAIGQPMEATAAEAKEFASFSGPMRSNLVAMLDSVGVARQLGIDSTASLWDRHAHLAHFTSAIRYPVFVDGANWGGNPDMLAVPEMTTWLERYTGEELRQLRNALLVPLGPKVTAALHHLAKKGFIEASRILDGLPHPSGANAERIAYFLGRKSRALLSAKTNPVVLDAARTRLTSQVAKLG